jgi:hypothetical protein
MYNILIRFSSCTLLKFLRCTATCQYNHFVLHCATIFTVHVPYRVGGAGRGCCNVNIEMVSTPVNNCTVVLLVNLATPLCIRCVDSCLSFIIPLPPCCNKGRKQVGGCRKRFENLLLWQSQGQLPTQNSINGQATSCDTLVINLYPQTGN